ncbi:protein SSX7-like [Rhinolophus ferrumequinum]|uniref:protein SSX7-like n=1 Tax=Rhinolophus ferrumequinum TaxID=59479 RepID=UPI00140FA864|nr:protein SSX7-like [Rhinolophus ferrumequinum]
MGLRDDLKPFGVISFGQRFLGLATGETRVVSLGHRTIPSAMDRGSSSAETHREDAQESQEKHEAFDDISKYFSKKQWAKLGDLQKRTYLYMKRKYDHMTRLGLSTNRPYFMRSQNQTTNAPESDAHEDQSPGNQDENPQAASDVEWTEHEKASVSQMTRTTRFWPSVDVNMEMPMEPAREENDTMPLPVTPASEPAPEKLCTPGEVSSSDQIFSTTGPSKVKRSAWAHRLRERKNRIVYEEISDPEEED